MKYLMFLCCILWFTRTKDPTTPSIAISGLAGSHSHTDHVDQINKKTILYVNLNHAHQTIHSFGASDCWTTKFIGDWKDVDKKNKIADLLFSMDTLSNGNPLGIGLSLWRFNIGAGSYEQGDSSGIKTDWRREECFLNYDGTYNWKKQSGQQWFLRAARKRKVKYTLGFAISPPVYMTKNKKAFNGTMEPSINLEKGKMKDYANFLVEVANHFHFNYISPVNEPQWSWGNGGASQEGTQATNGEIASLVKLLSDKLAGSPVKIVIGEAAQWNFLYDRNNDGRGDQINQFFYSKSSNYIGNLPNVAHAITAHSYFTTCPDKMLINTRKQVIHKIKQVDSSVETWQTEFGVLGNICDQYNGSPRHTDMDYGLYIAKVIHADLTVANVSSWQWWLAVNPYNYSDGLVYINDPAGAINVKNCRNDGVIIESKQLWALGNYSRFIRPGMKRVEARLEDLSNTCKTDDSLMVSAYIDSGKSQLVMVLVNTGDKDRIIQLKINTPFIIKNKILNAYLTSKDKNLNHSYMKTNKIKVEAESVLTLTGKYK